MENLLFILILFFVVGVLFFVGSTTLFTANKTGGRIGWLPLCFTSPCRAFQWDSSVSGQTME
jgi:ascorbate-specific PTS system EIIC-type component UlaA